MKSDEQNETKNENKPTTHWQPFPLENKFFDDYYKEQGIVPMEECDSFIEYLRRPLPAAFRINSRWEEVNVVTMKTKDVGIKKGAGCSWIFVKNSVHMFQAKDTSQERNSEIQALLAKLKREMKADNKLVVFHFRSRENRKFSTIARR
ncbi:hypothetical protein OSB04_026692 [Centaurea solstitialis]|uniref:Uncharacterized protein n=1 Tax=Centaurea solstitialis TaxID=347529 RepID=A0AA38W9I8_9ASTR|nr:hypothetical protein OSB04_026692 [Centaurea solstitialis]